MISNKKLRFLSVLSLICLSGCDNSSPQRIYRFGDTENFGEDLTVATSWVQEEERFVIDINKKDNHQMQFWFDMGTTNAEISEDFKTDGMKITFDDNVEVSFDEKGFYTFETSKKFYVSYKRFSERSKEILLNYVIDFHICGNTWLFDAKSFK